MSSIRSRTRLPLIESTASVVVLAVAIALTALPGGSPERAGRDRVLQDRLGVLRAALFRYQMEHGSADQEEHGNDGGKIKHPVADGPTLARQLTGSSRGDGTTHAPTRGKEDRWFGPYLETMPINPVNQLDTIRIADDQATTPRANGSAGWIFLPKTGRIYADLPGEDPTGMAFTSY